MQLSWIASSYGLWQYLISVKRLLISNTVNFADCLFRRQLYKQLALYSSMRTAKISKCCTFAGIRLRITWASMVWHRSEYKVKHSVRPLGQTNPKIQLFTFFLSRLYVVLFDNFFFATKKKLSDMLLSLSQKSIGMCKLYKIEMLLIFFIFPFFYIGVDFCWWWWCRDDYLISWVANASKRWGICVLRCAGHIK